MLFGNTTKASLSRNGIPKAVSKIVCLQNLVKHTNFIQNLMMIISLAVWQIDMQELLRSTV